MPIHLSPEVIRQASEGNKEAFRYLVEAYQAFAFAVSYRFVGNDDDAEDIVQEAFIRLWKSLPRYRQEIKITTWLYRIIANLCLDFLKSRRGKQRKNQVDISVSHSVQDPDTPEKKLHRQELMEAVWRAAEALTPKQRAVFILRDLEELPVEEVCSILSMSPGNIKSNLYYARLKVSEKLKAFYQTTDNQFIT